MIKERDSVISPYEDLKLVIDNYIYSIDNIKEQLKIYIEDEKKEKSNKISKNKIDKFCTACGEKSEISHKFCAHCGAKIE